MEIIYTKHAQERLRKRNLSKLDIEDTIRYPDKKYCSQSESGDKFIKKQGTRRYHVIAKYLPQQKAYLVVSAWVRGEEDQPDFGWRLITAPLRLIWWVIKKVFSRK